MGKLEPRMRFSADSPVVAITPQSLEELAEANSAEGIDQALAPLRGLSRGLVVPDESEPAASA